MWVCVCGGGGVRWREGGGREGKGRGRGGRVYLQQRCKAWEDEGGKKKK